MERLTKPTRPEPPRWAEQFLIWSADPDTREEVAGDLREMYTYWARTVGRQGANWRYSLSVLRLLRPLAKPKPTNEYPQPFFLSPAMIINYLKNAGRSLLRQSKKHKRSFVINQVGLSTGLAGVLLIYLWINDELRVDKFHQKDAQLYQIMTNRQHTDQVETGDKTAVPLAKALLETMPEVESAVSVDDFTTTWRNRVGILTYQGKHFDVKALHASHDFFSVFSFDLLQGNPRQVLADPTGIVISQELAHKLFKTSENVVGRTLDWKHASFDGAYRVTGVFAPHPNSSMPAFDVIFPLEVLLQKYEMASNWGQNYADTYVVLKQGANLELFNQKIGNLLQAKGMNGVTLFAQKYSSKYLYGNYENGVPVEGRMVYVRLFSITALLLLLIACINFMNLATAQATGKMKEIGVKKTLGVIRQQLVVEQLVEAALTVVLSLLIAFGLVFLLLPLFNDVTGKRLSVEVDGTILIATGAITVLTTLIAGLYPALYLSRFEAVSVLKGRTPNSIGELWVRKGLVIVQYTVSVVFMGVFIVIHQQLNLTQTKQLGYNRNNVLTFEWRGNLDNRFTAFVQALKQQPGVVNASNMSGGNLLNEVWGMGDLSWRGDDKDRAVNFKSPIVGYDFIETLGMQMLEGRSFSAQYANEHRSLIINEAARQLMGLDNPVGKLIKEGQGDRLIIGVVKNFHYGSLHNEMEPLIFRHAPVGKYVLVRMKPGMEVATIDQIKKLYKEFDPLYPFEFTFLDDEYRSLYAAETRLATLTNFFTLLALITSSLGLFALSDFALRRRFKEICIRKTLGSSVSTLLLLLTKDFILPIVIAIGIALPVSYLITTRWLEGFADRIELTWWMFTGAGFVTLVIGWFTVGVQTIKAARVNPVKGLREG